MSEVIPLRVAVRVRPLVPKEVDEGCQVCVNFVPGQPQLVLGKDRSFTYDYVFSITDPQTQVYDDAVKNLIVHIFRGYNATVLAYGQTGSGKTYTMGGGYAESLKMDPDFMGIIPRIVTDIFDKIEKHAADYKSIISVSYLEIINEDLVDLLVAGKAPLAIREDNGQIKIPGLTEHPVTCAGDTMILLEAGCQNRTTAATAMNSTSSRSHAVFTVSIEHRHKEDVDDFWRAKLQLVDLAGSERIKKTHAEGERLKEGININKGLLSLGNVISALGDESQKKSHIPYRDSKLTRILQDSLGGNSHTLMIACVSPADSNMEETLNTLRYADRARKIKNKPIVNWDPQSAKIMQLQEIVQQLNLRLLQAGITDVSSSVSSTTSSTETLPPKRSNCEELQKLKERLKEIQAENDSLTQELQVSVDQFARACEKNVRLEMRNDRLKTRVADFANLGIDFDILSSSMTGDGNTVLAEQLEKLKTIAAGVNKLKTEDTSEANTEADEDDDDEDDQEGNEESDQVGALETDESRQMVKQHTLKRARLNTELEELNRILEKKEKLANQMVQNDTKVLAIKEEYESTVKTLEEEISSLQNEKENLSSALQDAKTNSAASKVSEKRRKRLQELESQLADLKKKINDQKKLLKLKETSDKQVSKLNTDIMDIYELINDQKKLLKLKETSDKQVSKLNTDIMSMKQQRVKLMKQMKEDTDNFRKWKQQKDREVLQLQQKDRKRQFTIQKLQRENQQQQNFMQRKSEEAAAANKRLKEALAKQKAVLEDRSSKFDKFDKASVGNRIKKILSHELDVKVSVMEAKYHRQSLLDDRKTLAEELKTLKESIDDNGPPSKKMAWMDDSGRKCETSFKEEETKEKIKQLQEQIAIRNAQISDLQQKLFDAERDSKGKEAKDSIHTMMEAKIAVKWLLDQAVSFKADNDRVRGLLSEEKERQETSGIDQNKLMDEMERELEDQRNRNEKKILKLKKEHQKEIQLVLGATGSSSVTTSSEVQKTLAAKEEENKRLKKELALVEKHMTKYMYKEKSFALMPELTDDESNVSPFLTPRPKPKALRPRNSTVQKNDDDKDDDNDDENDDDADEDDDYDDSADLVPETPESKGTDKDPDWVWTPLLMREKSSAIVDNNPSKRRKTNLFEQPIAVKGKRKSDRGCGCTTKCKTKRCVCIKNGGFCDDYCRCKNCENKETMVPESTTDTLFPPLSSNKFPPLSSGIDDIDEDEQSPESSVNEDELDKTKILDF